MNANGLARAMVKGLSEQDFLKYVVKSVNRELEVWRIEGKVTQKWNDRKERCSLCITYQTLNTTVYIDLSMLSKFQKTGPYALDRFIWSLFENQGMSLPSDNYIETVFNENFHYPESVTS